MPSTGCHLLKITLIPNHFKNRLVCNNLKQLGNNKGSLRLNQSALWGEINVAKLAGYENDGSNDG